MVSNNGIFPMPVGMILMVIRVYATLMYYDGIVPHHYQHPTSDRYGVICMNPQKMWMYQ
jgi:hypothetical protein